MKVLIDTSVWSLSLRRRKVVDSPVVREHANILKNFGVVMLGPIRQEILSGIGDEKLFNKISEQLAQIPDTPILSADYERAARFFTLCRLRGIQGSNTDFLIGSVATRLKSPIFTVDKDFDHFARHLPILLHRFT